MTAEQPRPSASKDRLDALLETTDLTPVRKQMLRDRWLNQVDWMSRQSRQARKRHLWLRIPTVIGGVLLPGLVTILIGLTDGENWLGVVPPDYIRAFAFALSLAVALLAALEEVQKYGDRWRHYRRTAEILKTLGWQYLMLTGLFKKYSSHNAAFGAFTERVENTLNEDVEGYLGQVAAESAGNPPKHEIIA